MSQAGILTLPTQVLLINNTGVPPAAGTLGEQKRSYVAPPGISLTTATATTVTSIILTPGIWDIAAIASFSTPGIVETTMSAAISTTTNSFAGTIAGDNTISSSAFPLSSSDESISIPQYRANVTTTTSYFLVALATFSVGSITAYGRISATRVC